MPDSHILALKGRPNEEIAHGERSSPCAHGFAVVFLESPSLPQGVALGCCESPLQGWEGGARGPRKHILQGWEGSARGPRQHFPRALPWAIVNRPFRAGKEAHGARDNISFRAGKEAHGGRDNISPERCPGLL